MPKASMAKTKNGYQKMLWTYEKRRSSMKKSAHESDIKFRQRWERMTLKMTIIKRAIKRFEKKKEFLDSVNKQMIEFNGVSLFKIGGKLGNHTGKWKDVDISKKIFYKYCIEMGVRGNYIADYCGLKKMDVPSDSRRVFTRSFKTNQNNRDAYHKFIQFINNK